MNLAPAVSVPLPGSAAGGSSRMDPGQEEGRAEERGGVGEHRQRRGQELDQRAADAGTADEGKGAAAVDQRVALDVPVVGDDDRGEQYRILGAVEPLGFAAVLVAPEKAQGVLRPPGEKADLQ